MSAAKPETVEKKSKDEQSDQDKDKEKKQDKYKKKAEAKEKKKTDLVWSEEGQSEPCDGKDGRPLKEGWRKPGGAKNRGGTVYVEKPYKVCRIIATDGTFKDLPLAPVALKDAQKIVGGYVTIMPVADGSGRILLVNEEGILKGLKPNEKAAALVFQGVVGDAILCENEFFE